MLTDLQKVDAIVKHIQNVQLNCIKLGEKLIEIGEVDLGRRLIANSFLHDNSKLRDNIEWDGMWNKRAKSTMEKAINHHRASNLHHPQAWLGGIKSMTDEYLAEFVCDACTRSAEFGTSVREWIDNKATSVYNFTDKDEVYTKLLRFLDLLLEKPFEQVK